MSIANGLVLPNNITNGSTTDAVPVMADFNYLLAALNRAILDAGGASGANAQNVQIHNVADPTSAQDAATKAYADALVVGLAALASPAFTGTPTAPTAAPGTSTTQIATTAFVAAVQALLAPLASPALTGTPTAPTATPGDNTTQLSTTAFVTAAVAAAVAALQSLLTYGAAGTGVYVGIPIGGTTHYLQFFTGSYQNQNSSDATVNYPHAFTASPTVVCGTQMATGDSASGAMFATTGTPGLSSCTVRQQNVTDHGGNVRPVLVAFGH